MGNWEDSEMWNMEVKEPLNDLDGYMYAMDCQLGSAPNTAGVTAGYTNAFQCVFDTTTSVSSAFATTFTDYSNTNYNPDYSDTSDSNGVTKTIWSLGLSFTGVQYTDKWCIGGTDVHVNVCMDDQRFV